MAKHKYAFENYEQEAMARAVGLTLPLSTKVAVEICNVLRNRSLKSARTFLEGVVALKQAVPYRRFNKDVGHKPGIAAGRYPAKAAKEFLALLKSAEANAQVKGLHSSHLHLIHVCSHKASRPMRYGRHRGRLAKRTHVEIVLREKVQEKSKASSQKKGEKLVSQVFPLRIRGTAVTRIGLKFSIFIDYFYLFFCFISDFIVITI